MKAIRSLLVAALAAAGMAAHAAGVVIDDFNVTQALMTDTSTNGTGIWSQVNGAPTSILGGQRDLFVSKIAEVTDDPDLGAKVRVGGAPAHYSFSSDADQSGFGIIRWDGINALPGDASNAGAAGTINATGLGGVDLTVEGGNSFVVSVLAADLNFPFTLEAYTDAGNYSSLTLTSTGPGTYYIPFAAFAFGTVIGAGADFTNIGALQVIVNPGGAIKNVDFQIDIARTPEPGTLLLVGAAALGLGIARRRKSVAK